MKNLEPILDLLQTSRYKFVASANEVPSDLWRQSPGPERWSAAEVVVHVGMVEQAIITGAKKVLQAPPKVPPLLKRLHMPVALAAWRGAKRKSPIPLDASLVTNRPEAMSQLEAARDRTQGFIESTRDQDLRVYRSPHPFFGSLNIYDWFRLIAYHDLRHAQQIREVVETFHG
ncbi:MAG: DinB family protein [Candidatus Acidiferrales bacterium]